MQFANKVNFFAYLITRHHDGPLKYKLPLRSCNTMPQETVRIHKIFFFFLIGVSSHVMGRWLDPKDCAFKRLNKNNRQTDIESQRFWFTNFSIIQFTKMYTIECMTLSNGERLFIFRFRPFQFFNSFFFVSFSI